MQPISACPHSIPCTHTQYVDNSWTLGRFDEAEFSRHSRHQTWTVGRMFYDIFHSLFFPIMLYLPLLVHLHTPYLFIIIQKQAIHMHEYHTVDIYQQSSPRRK